MADTRKDNSSICALVTEANEKVASGHLMEVLELSSLLKKNLIPFIVLVNSDAPDGLKKRFNCDIIEYYRNVQIDIERLCQEIELAHVDIIITDLREVTNEWIQMVRGRTKCKVVCIDEFGRRRLDADVIVNPMIDPMFWDYKDSNAVIYSGHKYLVLPYDLGRYHDMEKIIKKRVQNICISMGGVDPHGTTIKLIEGLVAVFQNIKWNVVLGAGFRFNKEVDTMIENAKADIRVYKNIDFIYQLFFDADIVFTAGGNTLHELACIGTPAIVIPSNAHEINNGKMYEHGGFGKCIDTAGSFDIKIVKKLLDQMLDRETRIKMSVAGKKMCDGRGGERNVEIIKTLINK